MEKMTRVTRATLLIGIFLTFPLFAAGPIGYASLNVLDQNGTTGGAGGEVVTVSNAADLIENIQKEGPLIVLISGMIQLPGGMHQVSSDKTISGIGGNAGISGGGFNIGLDQDNSILSPPPNAVHNVIIQNLTFNKSNDDNVNVQMFSHHVWVHHNTFRSTSDGALDIKRGSSYSTVSYNHFIGIHKTALCGHSDGNGHQDIGRLRITYHHNFFENCTSRQPRVRFGEVHVFNNYYKGIKNYGIGVGAGSRTYSENNHKDGGSAFCTVMGGASGGLIDVGSIGGKSIAPDRVTWNPKDRYEYSPDPAGDVKGKVLANAGVGKIDGEDISTHIYQITTGKPITPLDFSHASTYNIKGQHIPEVKTIIPPGVYLHGGKY